MIVVHDGPETRSTALRRALRRRMGRAQRHRLLQGYPMAPLLRPVEDGFSPLARRDLDTARPLLVGVLPHPFCNPRVRGCGFCTFPHERFEQDGMRRVTAAVACEIERTAAAAPSLGARRVEGVYFGGGTANLTPPAELQRLWQALESAFDLAGSEVTLEGVPRYFLLRDEALLSVLAGMKVGHRRISMGVQTFHPDWLRRMGREAFGDRAVVEAVVAAAHRRGLTTSADLLFNLPGAPLAQALSDVQAACALGLDQICVYNLVLTPELDTEWARERSLVDAMPDPGKACATWLAVRETLLESGYVQTTLTNFERADVARSARRFRYERASFEPQTYDAIGFGPGGISTFTSGDGRAAVKWMNEGRSDAYVRRAAERGSAAALSFAYAPVDLRLLHLTRSFSKVRVDCAAYESFFGTELAADFGDRFDVLEEARLVRRDRGGVALTPEGMFFADAVAGFLAEERVRELAPGAQDRAVAAHMG